MRLIDKDNIKGCAKYIKTNENFEPYIMLDDLAKVLDEQPTAYDIDKVVEELELHSFEFGRDALPAHYVRLNKAIEIVKQGSASDDVYCNGCGKKIKLVD